MVRGTTVSVDPGLNRAFRNATYEPTTPVELRPCLVSVTGRVPLVPRRAVPSFGSQKS